jgi:hypothetical protein
MVPARFVPANYCMFEPADEFFYSSSQAEYVPSLFVSATQEAGWNTVVFMSKDRIDVEDSLKSLSETEGIDLEDFKRELGI